MGARENTGSRAAVVDGGASLEIAREALAHLDSLHHFARYFSGSATEAEDLVQETYARALGAGSSFVAGSNMRAWLFRILRNLHIDARRRAKNAPFRARGEDEEEAGELAADRASHAHEPLRDDVEMEALRGVVAGDIERALAQLTEDARAVVLLDLEGFREAELADILGCAPGTVKSRLARARETLRHLLSEYRR